MLQVDQLTKSFEKKKILDQLSFQLSSGQVAVLLGKSGAGKSTLLRCLNLLERAEKGRITLDGLQVDHAAAIDDKSLSAFRRRMGMVFQKFYLWPHLTVKENLLLAPSLLQQDKKETLQATAERLLTQLGVVQHQHKKPHQLSGGEQQRVAIARALMRAPQVILFDEPTASLDPENIQGLIKLLKGLQAEGKALLVSTHDIHLAKQVATHILFLHQGRLVEQGGVERLEKPVTPALKAFISSFQYELA